MYYTDDPVRDAERYYRDLKLRQEKRPICSQCGEHITEEFAYQLGDEWICESCMEECRKAVPEETEDWQ